MSGQASGKRTSMLTNIYPSTLATAAYMETIASMVNQQLPTTDQQRDLDVILASLQMTETE